MSLVSCKTTRTTPSLHDSTSIRVNTRIVYVKDTVWASIPTWHSEHHVRQDSPSLLENDYARSVAYIESDGTLFHALDMKDTTIPLPVLTKTIYKDSIVWRDRQVTVTKEVEKKLSRWQRMKQAWGGAAISVAAMAIVYFVIRAWYKMRF